MKNRIAITAGFAALFLASCRQEQQPAPAPAPHATAEAAPLAWPGPAAVSSSPVTSSAAAAAADEPAPTPAPSPALPEPGAAERAPQAAAGSEPAPARQMPPRPDVTPPTTPGDLVIEPTSERAVALHWTPSRDDVGVARYQILRADQVVTSVKATRAAEEGLRPGTSYCYTVRALDAAGNASPPAGPACAATPDLTPPTPPGQLTATALGETEVELRWTAATDEVGVTGYEVLREGRVVAGGPSLTTREKGLRAYAELCYAVRALDAAGNRSPPSAAQCVRTLDLTPPTAPQHVVAHASSDRSVEVLWQASTDNVAVEKYELVRAGSVVAESAGAWTEERELHPGVRYCYTVRAVDPAGNRSPASAAVCATTPDLTPPSVPDAVAAQPVSASAMFLAWEPSTDDVGVEGYEVVGDGSVVAKVAASDAVASGLEAGKHCFRVRAFDRAGNRSALSSAICGATADPAAPSAPFRLRAATDSEKAVRLTWHPSEQPGIVYRIYWEDGKNIGVTRGTGFNAIGLKAGERHCYQVGAVDEHGHESPRTLEACAAARTQSLSSR